MSLKRFGVNLAPGHRAVSDEALADEDAAAALMRADLEARGVASEFAERAARELAVAFAALPPPAYERALVGLAATWRSGSASLAPDGDGEGEAPLPVSSGSQSADATRHLRELQNLMSGFVGELAKLDEALEVLAAYLRRMRQNAKSEPAERRAARTRLLH
jgi:hypothetical protein